MAPVSNINLVWFDKLTTTVSSSKIPIESTTTSLFTSSTTGIESSKAQLSNANYALILNIYRMPLVVNVIKRIALADPDIIQMFCSWRPDLITWVVLEL